MRRAPPTPTRRLASGGTTNVFRPRTVGEDQGGGQLPCDAAVPSGPGLRSRYPPAQTRFTASRKPVGKRAEVDDDFRRDAMLASMRRSSAWSSCWPSCRSWSGRRRCRRARRSRRSSTATAPPASSCATSGCRARLLALLIGATLGPVRRGAAGPAAQSAGGAGAVRRAAVGGSGRLARHRLRPRAGDVVRRAGRRHRRRADVDRRACRHRRPARQPDGHAARRARARELCRRRHRAHPQPRAQSVHRARNRVLAARLARGPQHRSPRHRGAVSRWRAGSCSRSTRAPFAR